MNRNGTQEQNIPRKKLWPVFLLSLAVAAVAAGCTDSGNLSPAAPAPSGPAAGSPAPSLSPTPDASSEASPLPSAAPDASDGSGSAAPSATPAAPGDETLKLGGNVLYNPEGGPPRLTVTKDGRTTVLADIEDYPGEPQVSPDATKLAYLSPYEFEMPSEAWVYDHNSGSNTKVLATGDFAEGKKPTRLYWLDADHLLLLSGNSHGTIPSDRSMHVYRLSDGSFKEKYTTADNQHIQNLVLGTDSVSFELQTFDEQYLEVVETEEKQMPLGDLLD